MKSHHGGYLAIAAYRSLLDGVGRRTLDLQVRWFSESDPERIRDLIRAEPIRRYKNSDGQEVAWELVEIFAVEPFTPSESGQEIAGFIADLDEFDSLA